MKKIIMLVLVLSLSFILFAENVTIVYLDRTETNLEGGSYIKKQAKNYKLNYKFIYAYGFNALKGNEKVTVILNSGRSSGIDPRIEEFVASSQKKETLILVNLYSIGKNILMEVTPVEESLYGVDEISAASRWDESKAKSNLFPMMHKQWTAELFDLIQEKLAQQQ
ncbi:MAG: hypothetical protein ISR78_02845 [Spirochaetia bacterium]|nr:hypothetical protein [Spirochaetia bacterium]